MKCPRCSSALKHETYEGTEIDRCLKCRGTWLDEGELVGILNSREEKFSDEVLEEALNMAFAGVTQNEQASVEKCPKCSRQMIAVNYAYNSGIILDRCPNSHGVWLDVKELEKIQAYREHCEKEAEENRDEWIALARSVEEDRKKGANENRKSEQRPLRYIINSVLSKILGNE
ncbi:MAG: zf-TFIIB domain-containing protein [Bdellovibrionales bacterium]|nr:zf-TFIIB domain-containing protein [Bdellovibrionales bacterium]